MRRMDIFQNQEMDRILKLEKHHLESFVDQHFAE